MVILYLQNDFVIKSKIMTKKILILLTAIFSYSVCNASLINIDLYESNVFNNEHVKHAPNERSVQIMPSAVYDEDTRTIIITSTYFIENAHIIITNKNGNIISDLHTNLSEYEFLIQLYEKDEYKIEIEYKDTYLYGQIIV